MTKIYFKNYAVFFLGLVLISAGPAFGQVTEILISGGTTGGHAFGWEKPKTLSLQHGKYVDMLILNDKKHGDGGRRTKTLSLGPDVYISEVQVRGGNRVDSLRFVTNTGKSIRGGGGGGTPQFLKNVRVIRISGRAGNDLDSISIEYIPKYKLSTKIDNVAMIVSFKKGPSSIPKYKISAYRETKGMLSALEITKSLSLSASAKWDFLERASTLSHQATTIQELEKILKSKLNSIEESQKDVPIEPLKEKELYYVKAEGALMQDKGSDEKRYFLIPTSFSESKLPLDDNISANLTGTYDGTIGSELSTFLDKVRNVKSKVQNGFPQFK